MVTLSANGLPANRESELREALAIIQAGQIALQMRNNVTKAQCEAYARNAAFLASAANDRYRSNRNDHN